MAVNFDELPLPGELPIIPDGWRYKSLAELVEDRGVSYGIVQPGNETPDGVPVVRVNNIRNGCIDTTDVLKVTADIEAKFQRSRLRGGEVLLTLVGTLGEVAIVPETLCGWNVARAVGVIPVRKDPGSLWVSICLRSAFIQHCIRTWATTTVQATFNLRDLAKLPIPIPPTETREAIASVLGALDDRIELNRRMNATLEAMARALFQSWFVDFDPVRAKLDGRSPVGLDDATAALFPDSFDKTAAGQIPYGWRVGSIYEIANVTYGAPFASSHFNSEKLGMPLVRIRDLPNENPAVFTTEVHPKGYLLQPGDIAVGMDGEFRAYLWAGVESWLNQRCCVFAPEPGYSAAFVRNSIIAPLAHVEATETATTVIHLGKSDIDRFTVIIPNASVADAFKRQCQPWYDQIVANKHQSRTLATLRDTLLPKLLSGELEVEAISNES